MAGATNATGSSQEAARFQGALMQLAAAYAIEQGYCLEPASGELLAGNVIARVLREPVSMGAVFADLCELLDIEPPAAVSDIYADVWVSPRA